MSSLDAFFFYVFALMTIGGGILTVTRPNAVHAALALIVSLLGTAGLYLLQHAEFLFAVQIVLYIGGIMVLFLFVIMLVNLHEEARQRQFNRHWAIALVCLVAVGAEIAYFLTRGGWSQALLQTPAAPVGEKNTEAIGAVLFRSYLLPFEVVSLLLLVAMVGAVYLARKRA